MKLFAVFGGIVIVLFVGLSGSAGAREDAARSQYLGGDAGNAEARDTTVGGDASPAVGSEDVSGSEGEANRDHGGQAVGPRSGDPRSSGISLGGLLDSVEGIVAEERGAVRGRQESEQTEESTNRQSSDEEKSSERGDQGPTSEPIEKLQSQERERILDTPPATGESTGQRGEEIQIARQDIVAEKVEPIPHKHYVQLYKKSAKKYDFPKDWQILAAVGKIESNHGENMGPSSAGAMGPMQFLPSTWQTAGVDGNKDGEKNIMDPEDAIPAAAKYLKTGGAPDDWYAALYSYNHADWYVEKVLSVAEGYRDLDGGRKGDG